MRRRLRTVARWLVKTLLILTVASVTFNALTTPPKALAAPDGADVVVDGARVHYRVWGGHGTPIVLVHGFAESTVSWDLTARELAKTHTVYAVDLPGAGYSQYTGHYALSDQSRAVRGFLRVMHLTRPALVGHSLGAAVVGRVALDEPSAISGVIFADGDAMPFRGREGKPNVIVPLIAHTPYATSLYRLATRWNTLPRRIFDSQCGTRCEGLRGPAGERLIDAWMRPLRQGAAEDAMTTMAGQAMLHLTPEQAQAISTPRGIIWGAQDATSGGSLDEARRNFAGAHTVVLPGAGHLSMVADPPGFARAVETLIAGFPS